MCVKRGGKKQKMASSGDNPKSDRVALYGGCLALTVIEGRKKMDLTINTYVRLCFCFIREGDVCSCPCMAVFV